MSVGVQQCGVRQFVFRFWSPPDPKWTGLFKKSKNTGGVEFKWT